MTARSSVTSNGFSRPSRMMVSSILVPGLPRMSLTASFSAMPFTVLSSSLMMVSPALMPARGGRRVVDGGDHLEEAVLHADLDAHAAELAAGADAQLAVVLFVQVARVRVEAVQHALDGLLEELLVGHALDVVALDAAEHLGEHPQVLERHVPALGRGRRAGRGARTEGEDRPDQTGRECPLPNPLLHSGWFPSQPTRLRCALRHQAAGSSACPW